jgi:hypothetical protein
VIGLAPVGIGEGDPFGAQARVHPRPHRTKTAFDDELAAGGVADRAGDRTFEKVEPECKK